MTNETPAYQPTLDHETLLFVMEVLRDCADRLDSRISAQPGNARLREARQRCLHATTILSEEYVRVKI